MTHERPQRDPSQLLKLLRFLAPDRNRRLQQIQFWLDAQWPGSPIAAQWLSSSPIAKDSPEIKKGRACNLQGSQTQKPIPSRWCGGGEGPVSHVHELLRCRITSCICLCMSIRTEGLKQPSHTRAGARFDLTLSLSARIYSSVPQTHDAYPSRHVRLTDHQT